MCSDGNANCVSRIRIGPSDIESDISDTAVERLNSRYRELEKKIRRLERRLPFVFEFLGTPRAGKTTVRDMIGRLAEKAGLRVLCPPEGASLACCHGLREKLVAFNSWTGCYALSTLLEACIPENRWDLVLLDRGIVDATCWLEALRRLEYAGAAETAEAAREFFGAAEWKRLLDGLVLMTCDSAAVANRERKNQLTTTGERVGTAGKVVQELLKVYRDESFVSPEQTSGHGILLVEVDSSKALPKGVAFKVADHLAETMEHCVDPVFVTVPRDSVTFSGYRAASQHSIEEWEGLVHMLPRSSAETDLTRKQLVAYGFIERDGKLLRLHRTGPANRPELASRLSLGIGGHVEQTDWTGHLADTLERCLRRELDEELVFDAEPHIDLCGFINDESIDAGRYHVAAIYRVRLSGGRASVRSAIYDQEFGEKSWAFVSPETVFGEASKFDPWSRHIIHQILNGPKFTPGIQRHLPLEVKPEEG